MGLFRRSIPVLGALLIAAPALAAEDGRKPVSRAEYTKKVHDVFSSKDLDFDGYLSQEEQKSDRTRQRKERDKKTFSRMDIDKNGYITADEIRRSSLEQIEKNRAKQEAKDEDRFDKIDLDKNGYISRDEYMESRKKQRDKAPTYSERSVEQRITDLFERRDANRDKAISEREYVHRTDDQGRKPEKKKKERTRTLFLGRGEIVKIPQQDANGDKRISKFEYERYYEAVFNAIDKDRDETLSAAEQRAGSKYLSQIVPRPPVKLN